MYDPSFEVMPLGLDAFNPFSTGLPTIAQMNEAFSKLDPTLDVSGFGLSEWKQYDPFNLDIRNPYVGGYPTLGGSWDPLLDYDPYAPHIYDYLKVLGEGNDTMEPQIADIEMPTYSPATPMQMMDMNEDFISAGMFPNMPSPEIAHVLGLISDKDYAFLEMIRPKHDTDTPSYTPHEPVEHYPVVGPSKAEWERFNRHEAARAEAVEKYNDCIKNGNLEEASKWAKKAVDEQYAKEVIYSVPYVSDINQRAGLY